MTATTFRTHLVDKTYRAGDIYSFRFERPPHYTYAAGQWHELIIAGPDGPMEHHFSHSSSPTEPHLEFTTRLRGSAFKSALDALPLGAEVTMEGPYGSFTFEGARFGATEHAQPPEIAGAAARSAAFVTGGIGITAIRSILRSLADGALAPQQPPPLVLVYGNSDEEGIAFRDELADMCRRLPMLRVCHVLSRPSDAWTGRRGHVDLEVLRAELGDLDKWAYFLSGPPGMVQSLREQLVGSGVDRGTVKTERFEGYEWPMEPPPERTAVQEKMAP